MPQKKRSYSRKRTVSRARKSRRKSLRGKIYLPLNSVITLCAVIVGVCTVLLFAFSFAGKKEKVPRQVSANTEIHKSIEKKSPGKSEGKSSVKNNEKTATDRQVEKKSASGQKSSASDLVVASKTTKNPVPKSEMLEKPADKKNQDLPGPKKTDVSLNSAAKNISIIEENKNSDGKSSAWDIPDFPQAKNNAKLVFIFDDGGHNMQQLEKCVSLPFPVTVAVLPRLGHSAQAAERVRKSGNEVILHQPMQSVNLNVNPGDGAITPDMDEEKIRSTVLANIYEIWPVAGMNNHEGSLITADAEKIATVMKICSQQEIYFLDSRTNSDSKVRYVSSVMGYPYYERNIFLDNTKNRKDILSEIEKGVEFANKNGVAIMIGHVWSAEILPGILREVYPVLSAKGYGFSTVSNSGALKRG